MSMEEFERHKEALAAQRLEKPKRLSVLSARYWNEITTQQYNFDRANIEVSFLRTITKNILMDFYKVGILSVTYIYFKHMKHGRILLNLDYMPF